MGKMRVPKRWSSATSLQPSSCSSGFEVYREEPNLASDSCRLIAEERLKLPLDYDFVDLEERQLRLLVLSSKMRILFYCITCQPFAA